MVTVEGLGTPGTPHPLQEAFLAEQAGQCGFCLSGMLISAAGLLATIGIVLCKQKNKALVEITLPKDANIHAREYQLYLPSKDELQKKLMEWIEPRR